jgi:rSAM/selenodomain-associated transferase 1
MTNTLGIFAKHPTPGQVKTRLAAATSPEFAAQVADAMLRDTLDRLAAIDAERWLVFTPHDAAPTMGEYPAGRYGLTPQGDGDLGQRLRRFLEEHMRSGTERIVVVGSDSPTLPVHFVVKAFDELQRAEVVLGPASDGGYYLIGCTRSVPMAFDGIAWGGSTVLTETIARLDTATPLAVLPPWYDVDTFEDWQILEGHVTALRKAGIDPGVPHTETLFAFNNPRPSRRATA